MSIALNNYTEWFPFAFIIVGVVLALIAPFLKSGSRHSNTTMQLLANFKMSLHEHDIDHWKVIYHGTGEAASAPAGHFINRTGKTVPLASMWAAGSEEHMAIQRMAEGLEKVCAGMLAPNVDVKIIWSEIGQLMEAMHGWLKEIPGMKTDSTFLEEQYPSIKQIFDQYGNQFNKWPCRVYAER